ncbi:DUF3500 domain-containing protein [Croceicoccus gelatinilyticus]|uniref:DUF3500 domain-containing protein n=1 Tax=Croceicoccus gelatinilyticus TaxID=2835536 RepID=UPI001BD10D9F|nr:DUF3500 domain-containing protein [Croceicoccus gelatinilyticus]MBS7671077.1 DUF3500 domain-containing protein [Croceicoccus gelatinilyticus]
MKAFALRTVCAAAVLVLAVPINPVLGHEKLDAGLEKARVQSMQDATERFLAALDEEQRAKAMVSLDDSEARTIWSNLPVSMAPRAGVAVADLTAPQRMALHAMISAALSSQGYLKTTTIMWHEDILRDLTDKVIAQLPDDDPRKAEGLAFAANYDAEKFFVRVFGNPIDDDWGWLLTGHHYAASITVSDGKIAFFPLFLGASPQVVPEGRFAGWRIMQHEADRALALLSSLRDNQLKSAVISNEVDAAIFAGPGNQDAHLSQFGITASDLDTSQRRLLYGLVHEYLGDASDEAASRQQAAIDADGLGSLRFAWWGPADEPRGRYMFRVQGPSVLIDYIRERSPDGGYNHVHSILRDPSNDYGAGWLARHYEEKHSD